MTVVKSKGTAPKRSRAEWSARFERDKARGMTGLAIARKYGLSHSFVNGVLADPTGALDKRRKRAYGGRCEKCGAATDGSNGRAAAPKICGACAPSVYGPVQRARTLGKGPSFVRLRAFLATGEKRYVEIRDHLGISSGYASVMLNRYVRYGRVVRVSRGLYRLP